jgi:peroxiredoxin
MHDTTVADAIATGRPVVVAFTTPAFCVTRTCGPIMDTVADPLYERYGGEAAFIHIEPYRLKELREGTDRIFVEAMEEWSLQTEPWLFIIDRQGRIAAKFEGVAALDEVESVLQQVLAEGGGG